MLQIIVACEASCKMNETRLKIFIIPFLFFCCFFIQYIPIFFLLVNFLHIFIVSFVFSFCLSFGKCYRRSFQCIFNRYLNVEVQRMYYCFLSFICNIHDLFLLLIRNHDIEEIETNWTSHILVHRVIGKFVYIQPSFLYTGPRTLNIIHPGSISRWPSVALSPAIYVLFIFDL